MRTIFIMLSIVLVVWFTTALFLWLGAKWVRIPRVSYALALAATLANALLSVLLRWGLNSRWSGIPAPLGVVLGVEISLGLLVPWLLYKRLLDTSLVRAIGAWLVSLVPSAATLALVFLALKPYVLEAFIVSNDTMAPTLLGPHQRGICPHCGQFATVAYDPRFDLVDRPKRWGMCDSCQQAGAVLNIAPQVFPADRFFLDKLLAPRRWDLVAFHSLQDPSVLLVKRLVGLPGEEILIREGAIWINGAKQTPPSEISKVTFAADPDGATREAKESSKHPLQLGPDECFVIGDFSLYSADSRTWGPVPGSHIEGVASAVYWPLSRWRIIR